MILYTCLEEGIAKSIGSDPPDSNESHGQCTSYCGAQGWCCRKGQTGNGCNGRIGGSGKHVCIPKPGLNEVSFNFNSLTTTQWITELR